jgi:hypothetical protein
MIFKDIGFQEFGTGLLEIENGNFLVVRSMQAWGIGADFLFILGLGFVHKQCNHKK